MESDQSEEKSSAAKIQLAAEIAWCVEQIDNSLTSGKLNEKQVKDFRRIKKLLQNPDTQLIKLRQVMRTKFGDYRAKMRVEEDKNKSLDSSKIKFTPKPSEGTSSSFFKKKSENKCDQPVAKFKFNFNVDSNADES